MPKPSHTIIAKKFSELEQRPILEVMQTFASSITEEKHLAEKIKKINLVINTRNTLKELVDKAKQYFPEIFINKDEKLISTEVLTEKDVKNLRTANDWLTAINEQLKETKLTDLAELASLKQDWLSLYKEQTINKASSGLEFTINELDRIHTASHDKELAKLMRLADSIAKNEKYFTKHYPQILQKLDTLKEDVLVSVFVAPSINKLN